jgi:uncharacterized membrane protein YqaE (UPF0057 family)
MQLHKLPLVLKIFLTVLGAVFSVVAFFATIVGIGWAWNAMGLTGDDFVFFAILAALAFIPGMVIWKTFFESRRHYEWEMDDK